MKSSKDAWLRALPWLAMGLAIAAFAAMRIVRLTALSLDGDEIFSVGLATSTWPQLWESAVRDAIHPPLFYFLLKLWIGLGNNSLWWMRLLPAVISLLGLIPFHLLSVRLGMPWGARAAAVFVAASHPLLLHYDSHLRMYCLLTPLVLWSAYLFLRYLDEANMSHLRWLTVVNIALVYTQYYGWFIIALEGAYILLRGRLSWKFLGSVAVVAVAFAPWAVLAGSTLRGRGLSTNLGWIAVPTFNDVLWFFGDVLGLAYFGHNLEHKVIAALAVSVVLALLRRRFTLSHLWPLLLCLGPPALAYGASHVMSKSIWGHRHLVFVVWPFLMLALTALWSWPRPIRWAALVAIAVWSNSAVNFALADDRKVPFDKLTVAVLSHNPDATERIPLYGLTPSIHYPFWFFTRIVAAGDLGPLGPRGSVAGNLISSAKRFDVETKLQDVDALVGHEFWIAYSVESWKRPLTPAQILTQKGCHTGPEFSERDRFHRVVAVYVTCP